MGSRCLLVIFVSGNNRLPVPPASTTPFISSYHTVMSMWGRLANPGQPPYFRQTAPEIGTMNVPERDEELTLAKRMLGQDSPEAALASGAVRQTLSAETLAALRAQLNLVVVRDELLAYIVDIVRASRK